MGSSQGKSGGLNRPQELEEAPIDSTVLSGLVVAVIHNNAPLLRSLLKLGASVNATNYDGNTPLHFSVMNDSSDVFNFLLNCTKLQIDAVNCHGSSALIMASMHNKKYYAEKLIRKGANINLMDKLGFTPLHHAIYHSSVDFCHYLIQHGADVNARNQAGETSLHVACQYGCAEKVYMLLYYGAEASIPCHKGIIPLFIPRVNTYLRTVLYNYTFDNLNITMGLKTLTSAMAINWARIIWPLFPEMIANVSTITYDKSDLQFLNASLPDIQPQRFKLFLDKFDYVVKDMLQQCCTLTNYLTVVEGMLGDSAEFVDFLYILLESDLVDEFLQSRCDSVSTISSLVKIFHKYHMSLNTLTELVCCMLSYGLNVTATDLNAVYVFYGRCELFQIMLHMDIEPVREFVPCCSLYNYEVVQQSIMPHFIYDVNLNIDSFVKNPRSYLLMDLDVLLEYFALPKLKDFFMADGLPPDKIITKLERLPTVPCLIELARNAARDYFIKRLHVRNSGQFYTIIKCLPINDVYKKILSFEKKLYHI